jgi:hypothetical protein
MRLLVKKEIGCTSSPSYCYFANFIKNDIARQARSNPGLGRAADLGYYQAQVWR